MNVLIFGATGGTGRELVRQAIDRGHSVTAFARDPTVLGERHGLRWLAGDVLDAGAVEQAVAGHDVVLCVLGAPAIKPGTVRSERLPTRLPAHRRLDRVRDLAGRRGRFHGRPALRRRTRA
jgi:uncharacterized protein YbjT (DUF2867 family)